ncbi:MAG: TetR family transcriptional regulator [Anaerolineales bacterium]
MKRAIRDEQKEERRQAILETAGRMFAATAYEAVTIAAVARKARLAKGTVFLYFPTKEELFLALTEQQLGEWFETVDARLARLKAPASIEQVVKIMADSLKERAAFIRLLAILATVLEQNIAFESALRFKRILMARLAQTGAQLERCLPFLAAGGGAHLLLQCQAIVVGLWHLSDPAPVVQEVFVEPEMHLFDLNFDREFRQMLTALLHGLEMN